MKISTTTINKIQPVINQGAGSVDSLIKVIGERLGAVEAAENLFEGLENAVIINVVEKIKHPDADKLSLCLIDDGGKINLPSASRRSDGLVQVVCGAPNARAGMLAVWLPPGSVVPSTIKGDPFRLESREIRGQVSNGMLASAKELGLFDDHSGILEINDDFELGTALSQSYDLTQDTLIEIENKMFTHRPDCFGWLGVAREIAGITGQKFESPSWYKTSEVLENDSSDQYQSHESELFLEVDVLVPDLVKRFSAAVISGVKVGLSPLWLKIELAKHGVKSINNVVDLTNYYMLLTGQPMHAYDYDKALIAARQKNENPEKNRVKIVVRKASEYDRINLLNGKEIAPWDQAIVIASEEVAIGLGGVMGGSQTEVDEQTVNIILESANFDMYNIRRTSMHHGLFTDAVTRFSKNQSPEQTVPVLKKCISEIIEITGGRIASNLVDIKTNQKNSKVNVPLDLINDRLGYEMPADEIKTILSNVEFDVNLEPETNYISVLAPFWRTDISIAEDVIEEIARLSGFENLPKQLPRRSTAPAKYESLLDFKNKVIKTMASFGANEVYLHSFVSKKLLSNAQQDYAQAYEISNALSPELQVYRLSLAPGLLEKVHSNHKQGHKTFTLFEANKVHSKLDLISDEDKENAGLPSERTHLAAVYSSDAKYDQLSPAYFQSKNTLVQLLKKLKIQASFKPASSPELDGQLDSKQYVQPFDFGRSAAVISEQGKIIGIVGEFKNQVTSRFKLPTTCSGFEIDLEVAKTSVSQASGYRPISKYPALWQDVCLQVNEDLNFVDLENTVKTSLDKTKESSQAVVIFPLDIHTNESIKGSKRITFRVEVFDYKKTLTEPVVSRLLDEVANEAAAKHQAQRI